MAGVEVELYPGWINCNTDNLNEQLWIGLLLSLILASGSFRIKILDSSGCIAAAVLGVILFGIGGWPFSAPILAFFILSSVLSKVSESRRAEIHQVFQKSSRRDAGQVLANGGVAAALVLIWQTTTEPICYFLYLGAVAAVTADTWATEIGVWAGQQPRFITTWQRVPAGTSGGLSMFGLLGAFLGSGTVTFIGWLAKPASAYDFGGFEIVTIVICGVIAHLLDSILGATIQAQYLCPVCGKQTERVQHCERVATRLHRGWAWVNNDLVNGLCALGGALMVLAVLS